MNFYSFRGVEHVETRGGFGEETPHPVHDRACRKPAVKGSIYPACSQANLHRFPGPVTQHLGQVLTRFRERGILTMR